MAKVYSSQLFIFSGPPGGGSATAEVPSGYVWVLRTINAYCEVSAERPALGFKVSSSSGEVFASRQGSQAWSQNSYTFDLRSVMNPFEILTIETFFTGWTVGVSGYALQLP